jgi:hypothetical protein
MTIQRYPFGLPGLLDMKAGGDVPVELAQVAQGTLDLAEFYLAPRLRVAGGSTAALNTTGFFQGNNLTVPAQEIWVVRTITISAPQNPAATTYRARPAYVRAGFNLTALIQGGPASVEGNAGDRLLCGWSFDPYRLFMPGDAFGVWIEDVTLGTATAFDVSVDYVPVLI